MTFLDASADAPDPETPDPQVSEAGEAGESMAADPAPAKEVEAPQEASAAPLPAGDDASVESVEPAAADYATGDSDFVSYGGNDDDDYDDDDMEFGGGGLAVLAQPKPRVEKVVHFDMTAVAPMSFASLLEARATVYRNRPSYAAFQRQIEEFADTGDAGRLKGLGLWVLAQHKEAVAQLAQFAGDDVVDFTRAKSLLALDQNAEAGEIFEKLSQAHPDEPRPRGAAIEAKLRATLRDPNDPDQVQKSVELLDNELNAAPDDFGTSADGHYLSGRMRELERDFESAIDHYSRARKIDPNLRENLVRGAYLSERCGLDKLAIEMYETLLERHLADRSTILNLGVLYEDVGRDEDAAACYDVLVQDDPTDVRARKFLEDARSAMDMYYDEDLERKEDKLNQILRIPITDFELSVRARNCLNKMQIHTLGDLVTKTEQELMSYKNFGETSLNEIKEILRSKALRLGMPREEAVASIENRAKRPVSSNDPSDLSNKPIGDLQLSIRARRTVEALGCLTVADITKHSADELLGMPNFGTTSLQELRSKLTELSAKLAGE